MKPDMVGKSYHEFNLDTGVTGAMTLLEDLSNNKTVVYLGFAYCSDKEPYFDFNTGREIAVRRMNDANRLMTSNYHLDNAYMGVWGRTAFGSDEPLLEATSDPTEIHYLAYFKLPKMGLKKLAMALRNSRTLRRNKDGAF